MRPMLILCVTLVLAGTVHYVKNTASGVTSLLGLLDHPQAGVVFVPNAINAVPKDVRNGAFMGMPPGGVSDAIFILKDC